MSIFSDLTSEEKVRLAIGAAVVAGLGVVAYLSARAPSKDKKDYGIEIDDLCVNATVTNHEKLRRAIEDTYDTAVEAGSTDPLVMTTGFFATVAPQCQIYPKQARSPKEAEFFLTVFLAFLEQLEIDNLITDDEARAKMFEAMAWASRSGWKPTESIDELLPSEGE